MRRCPIGAGSKGPRSSTAATPYAQGLRRSISSGLAKASSGGTTASRLASPIGLSKASGMVSIVASRLAGPETRVRAVLRVAVRGVAREGVPFGVSRRHSDGKERRRRYPKRSEGGPTSPEASPVLPMHVLRRCQATGPSRARLSCSRPLATCAGRGRRRLLPSSKA